MTLRRLQVTDFRCLQSARMDLDPRFTLISGPNASGKTSLLEAIYILGRGRSFRSRTLDNLIRTGAQQFTVFGEAETSSGRISLGVEGGSARVKAKLGGEVLHSVADLATALPVQIIDPEVHRLIEEGPSRRRRFLDWGVFHVEPSFVRAWQGYHRVLRQRNAALKARHPQGVVAAWDVDLIRYGVLVSHARSQYVERLLGYASPIAQTLLGKELSLTYRHGWSRERDLSEALEHSWALDRERATTHVGPQRADLSIKLDGVAVKDRISRGQQKLLAAALLIAQIKFFPAVGSAQPSLLLDDPAAELDGERLGGLIAAVLDQSVQLVVTTLQGGFEQFGTPGIRYRTSAGSVMQEGV